MSEDIPKEDLNPADNPAPGAGESASNSGMDQGTYELLRRRLESHGTALRDALDRLDADRRVAFGAVVTELTGSQAVSTRHNCVPRDMVSVGSHFLFGYNVQFGLKTETVVDDVLSVYHLHEGSLVEDENATVLSDPIFQNDFKNLYKFYRETRFLKFAVRGPLLFMVFQVGRDVEDIKVFKWARGDDGALQYIDARSEHQYTFPPQHDFEWVRATRDMHRGGLHPHISIEDICYVETVGGDLTIKVEDNSADGSGVYAESVDNPDQTLDDADTYYAILGEVVLLKIRPYQEEEWRYFIFNARIQEAMRVDSIGHSAVLLPEDHGLIFANGYYLLNGEYRQFETAPDAMLFERRVDADNGEDFLYIFYHRERGEYVLLQYNLIAREVQPPLVCNGFCRFDDGRLLLFQAEAEAQKHHMVQTWQTPFFGANHVKPVTNESPLQQIGNKPLVRTMAEARAILKLIDRDQPYTELYADMAKSAGDLVEGTYWIARDDTHRLDQPLAEIRDTATAAVEAFDKVRRQQRQATERYSRVDGDVQAVFKELDAGHPASLDLFVRQLASLRKLRGDVISLREVRYMNLEHVEALENDLVERTETLSLKCRDFLTRDEALAPYEKAIGEVADGIQAAETAKQASGVEEALDERAGDLEMLIEIVSALPSDDPTRTTAIVDRISGLYSELNAHRSRLRERLRTLQRHEGVAEFNAQLNLINHSVSNYLEVSDTPKKCDEYANRLLVQLEELEGRFGDFDEFVVELAERRTQLFEAFEQRKLSLLEARGKRAENLTKAAGRILEGVAHRAANYKTEPELNAWFAADPMIDKVRAIVRDLQEIGESVKADELNTRLRTAQEDAVRQLRDRSEIYSDGGELIRFGRHQFSVNRQELRLTPVQRDGAWYAHLNGTAFFEELGDASWSDWDDVYDMERSSETATVYRGEMLAWLVLNSKGEVPEDHAGWLACAREIMADRLADGYQKGVHDEDAARIAAAVYDLETGLGLLCTPPNIRARALLAWEAVGQGDADHVWGLRIADYARRCAVLGEGTPEPHEIDGLAVALMESGLLQDSQAEAAAGYLYGEALQAGGAVLRESASQAADAFEKLLKRRDALMDWRKAMDALVADPVARFEMACDWLRRFSASDTEVEGDVVEESAAALLLGKRSERRVVAAGGKREVDGLRGEHARLREGKTALDVHDFRARLADHGIRVVPRFEAFQAAKKVAIEGVAERLRLDEFKPKVLSSFVRNRLINEVYLPLLGDNLAKQIGTSGEGTRSDRSGLLLVISPPGYGKTTLMEYVANRLGLTFVKVNGPALGHDVTSLDPGAAPNAAARQEVERINLCFEMGDNVMLYLDDIQHTNPELLQKFISLCDAQRRVEGVYKGQSKTYDLRGRKVAVVMAGNPYTESGEAFQIPDMLSNRADTYNLGDILGDHAAAFKQSYIENGLTSNAVLAPLARQPRADIEALIRAADRGQRDDLALEGNLEPDAVTDILAVLEHMVALREVVLKVNQAYIRSAGMEDAYRNEPPFKLQGSYRNMNRMAEKVVPIMTEEERTTLVMSSYESEAQTLTTGAEANLLNFREMMGWLDEESTARWAEIRKAFQRKNKLAALGGEDRMSALLVQIETLGEGLEAIQGAIQVAGQGGTGSGGGEGGVSVALIETLRDSLAPLAAKREFEDDVASAVPAALSQVLTDEAERLRAWMDPVLNQSEVNIKQVHELVHHFNRMVEGYNTVLSRLKDTYLPNLPAMKKAQADDGSEGVIVNPADTVKIEPPDEG